jgi:hypothetical protein
VTLGVGAPALAATAALAALAACADDGGPRLAAVTPAAARRDAMVMVTGSRLCGARGDCVVAAGEVALGRNPPMLRAVVVDYSDTAARIVVPSLAPIGKTVVIAIVDERSSNALDFEVLP